jgi:hypothetical protein
MAPFLTSEECQSKALVIDVDKQLEHIGAITE